jgi:hypothetical protein
LDVGGAQYCHPTNVTSVARWNRDGVEIRVIGRGVVDHHVIAVGLLKFLSAI